MSALFMLDTDCVSYALRGQGNVGKNLLERVPSEICVSAITVAELRYGAERRRSSKLHRLITTFTNTVTVVPFDEACAAMFGKVASKLVAKGRPIGNHDTLIAAHALALGITLVTNNEKHFKAVESLKMENWA
jgi:tRNA(fMet)-specific endonuclease VapC